LRPGKARPCAGLFWQESPNDNQFEIREKDWILIGLPDQAPIYAILFEAPGSKKGGA
jgi:hypothetical protein